MQASDLGREWGAVAALGGRPVTEEGLCCLAVRQAVGDREASISFQLRQDHQDLCRGGTLSWVRRLPRVDTTLKLSEQSHCTCR